jgi:hypothetical protein
VTNAVGAASSTVVDTFSSGARRATLPTARNRMLGVRSPGGPTIVVYSACPLLTRSPVGGRGRNRRSNPPERVSSRHESRWSFCEAGLFDPGLLLEASPRTRSCSHDIFATGTPTLMCFPGAELLRIDDAPTPSASELEMSTPLSKSREHRSRGPKPRLRSEPPKRHQGNRRRSRAGPRPRHSNEQY